MSDFINHSQPKLKDQVALKLGLLYSIRPAFFWANEKLAHWSTIEREMKKKTLPMKCNQNSFTKQR